MIRLSVALLLAMNSVHLFAASLPVAMSRAGRTDFDIGVAVGALAIAQALASIGGAMVIRSLGGRVSFLAGCLTSVVAGAAFATGTVTAGSDMTWMLTVRLLQGLACGLIFPAALSIVPDLVGHRRLGAALGLVTVAPNIALAVAPPLSLPLVTGSSLTRVGLGALVSLLAAILVMGRRTGRRRVSGAGGMALVFRRRWLVPILASGLAVLPMGVLTGYLPQRAEVAGVNPGLFFAASAVFVVVTRVVGGLLAGSRGVRPVVLAAGAAMATSAAIVGLFPLNTTVVVFAGIACGTGNGLLMPACSLELHHRSLRADGGSAFAFLGASTSFGVSTGALGMGPVVSHAGLGAALAIGWACAMLSMAITLLGLPRCSDRPAGPELVPES